MTVMIEVRGAGKDFTLWNQGGARIPVIEDAALTVSAGECVGLAGASGAGKSTLMRMIQGNYLTPRGSILVAGVEVAGAAPRTVIALRRGTLGHVSQFLRVVPRVPAREVVAEPLLALGHPREEALARAEAMLARLNVPARLRGLSPTTFSGASSSG